MNDEQQIEEAMNRLQVEHEDEVRQREHNEEQEQEQDAKERARVKEHCHNLKVLRGFYKGRKALMEQAQAHCQRYPELDNELIKAYSLHLSFTDIYKVQEIIKKLDKVIAQYE